jgi:hypothetical protein
VLEVVHHLRFLEEAVHDVGPRGELLAQHLDGHLAPKPGVPADGDLAHPAFTEPTDELVSAEDLPHSAGRGGRLHLRRHLRVRDHGLVVLRGAAAPERAELAGEGEHVRGAGPEQGGVHRSHHLGLQADEVLTRRLGRRWQSLEQRVGQGGDGLHLFV